MLSGVTLVWLQPWCPPPQRSTEERKGHGEAAESILVTASQKPPGPLSWSDTRSLLSSGREQQGQWKMAGARPQCGGGGLTSQCRWKGRGESRTHSWTGGDQQSCCGGIDGRCSKLLF